MGSLTDTNVIIDYIGDKLPPSGRALFDSVAGETPNISVVTKIEFLSFDVSPEEYVLLTDFIECTNVISLSDQIVDTTISIRRVKKMKLGDAIIAATALVYGFPLLTRNTVDFNKIDGLKLLNPKLIPEGQITTMQ